MFTRIILCFLLLFPVRLLSCYLLLHLQMPLCSLVDILKLKTWYVLLTIVTCGSLEREWAREHLGEKVHSWNNRPLSHGGHFASQENKRLCFCPSSLALDERLDGQNLLF